MSVTRTAWSVLGNSQRLDGGSMFGNAPKALWQRWITPDEDNRIPLSCRALLIREQSEAGERNILFEAGIGAFFSPKMKERFGVVESGHVLLSNLSALSIDAADIDVVVLSHLHFDHAGGVLSEYDETSPLSLVFPNASYVVGQDAWNRATSPHPRDRASFIPELLPLLSATKRVELVDGSYSTILGDSYRMHFSQGHTPGLMLCEVPSADGNIVFAGDLIPGAPWMHLPITMGYDRFPELLIEEKEQLLTDLLSRGGRIFFTHDHEVALCSVARDERNKFHASQCMKEVVSLPLA